MRTDHGQHMETAATGATGSSTLQIRRLDRHDQIRYRALRRSSCGLLAAWVDGDIRLELLTMAHAEPLERFERCNRALLRRTRRRPRSRLLRPRHMVARRTDSCV
jgi:hypothetical protein